jgi:hypothetical protein
VTPAPAAKEAREDAKPAAADAEPGAPTLAASMSPVDHGPPADEPVAIVPSEPAAPAPPPGPATSPAPESASLLARLAAAKPAAASSVIVEPAVAGPAAAPQPAIMRTSVATVLPPPPPIPTAAVHHPRGSGFINALAYLIAIALASIAAYFSINGMTVLFPGAPTPIVVMGIVMESAKLVTVAFLAHQWRTLAWLSRIVLVMLVAGLAAINAAGVYSQLVAAHFGDRGTATSAAETEAATLAAKTEVQTQTVADLDRRVAQIDAAIAEMTRRGRAAGALDAIAAQHKQRDALVGQRRQEADKLAALKSDAAAVTARTHRIETEMAPIMYVAQLMGGTTEQAIRLLILLMVLTCDPLALALTAAASRPRLRGR